VLVVLCPKRHVRVLHMLPQRVRVAARGKIHAHFKDSQSECCHVHARSQVQLLWAQRLAVWQAEHILENTFYWRAAFSSMASGDDWHCVWTYYKAVWGGEVDSEGRVLW